MSDKTSTRAAYGKALQDFGGDSRVVVLDADLACCTMSYMFAEKYPERFFNIGIAEANMVGIGAGLATAGKTVFVNSFAMFSAGRAFEQIRNSVAYPHLNVKVVGTHAGLSVGEDGATHQCVEDLAIMRAIPGMTVVCPSDEDETYACVKALIELDGPAYLRLGRLPVSPVTNKAPDYRFELGKGVVMAPGGDVAIIATGLMLQESMKARDLLKAKGIDARVIDIHTIKPLDTELVLQAAKECGAIVTAEEHNILGGLGGAVAEAVGEGYPVPVLRVGVDDCFGRSGTAAALLERYGLTPEHIAEKAVEAIKRKR